MCMQTDEVKNEKTDWARWKAIDRRSCNDYEITSGSSSRECLGGRQLDDGAIRMLIPGYTCTH